MKNICSMEFALWQRSPTAFDTTVSCKRETGVQIETQSTERAHRERTRTKTMLGILSCKDTVFLCALPSPWTWFVGTHNRIVESEKEHEIKEQRRRRWRRLWQQSAQATRQRKLEIGTHKHIDDGNKRDQITFRASQMCASASTWAWPNKERGSARACAYMQKHACSQGIQCTHIHTTKHQYVCWSTKPNSEKVKHLTIKPWMQCCSISKPKRKT